MLTVRVGKKMKCGNTRQVVSITCPVLPTLGRYDRVGGRVLAGGKHVIFDNLYKERASGNSLPPIQLFSHGPPKVRKISIKTSPKKKSPKKPLKRNFPSLKLDAHFQTVFEACVQFLTQNLALFRVHPPWRCHMMDQFTAAMHSFSDSDPRMFFTCFIFVQRLGLRSGLLPGHFDWIEGRKTELCKDCVRRSFTLGRGR